MGKAVYVFPTLGKTYYCSRNKDAIELSSELYHWKDYKTGENNKGKMYLENEKWPDNYVAAIKENIDIYDFVFITHSGSILCRENNIPYSLVYPSMGMKNVILKRMKKRNNSKDVIDNMLKNYEKYITDCKDDKYAVKKIMLENDIYLSDIISRL